MPVWIGDIMFEEMVARKINAKHHLTVDEVREALSFGHHHRAAWHDHPVYGRRLVVTGETSAGRRIIAYLRPIDANDGMWECLTCLPREE